MLKFKFSLICLFITVFLNSCLTNLQTDYYKTNKIQNKDIVKGKKLLLNAFDLSHLKVLNEAKKYEVNFSDEFLNLKGAFANPYKTKQTHFKLTYQTNSFNGKMTILNGKEKDKTFGIENSKTYEIKNNVKQFKKNKRSQFWIPTYQYFIEFPRQIITADKIIYAGQKMYNNKLYDLVLVSWKTFNPQKNIDQYVIWLSKKTGYIEILQYTIRDYYGFIQGVTFMESYKNFNGLMLPSIMKVKSKLNNNKLMHVMQILKISVVN